MRKIVTLVLCLVLALSLVGCSKKMDKNTTLNDVEKLSSELQGKSRTEVHEVLGEPDGELFGLDGEIYYNSTEDNCMESIIVPIAIGALIIVLGVNNLKGNINSIHWYHRKRVAEEDKAAFGKLMGIGTIVCGAGCILLGLFSGLTELLNRNIFIIIGSVLVVICIVVGLGISFYAMFKYNKGIF